MVAFFLDFSFIPSFFGSELSWPYSLLSLLIAVFLFNKDVFRSIGWGITIILAMNVVLPLSLLGYVLIVTFIWGVIYVFENVFFSERQNYLKSNVSFVVNFVLFEGLFFVGQYVQSKISGEIPLGLHDMSWKVLFFKLLIGVFIYNLSYRIVYKVCVKNIQVLR
jgi:hypothetical protein